MAINNNATTNNNTNLHETADDVNVSIKDTGDSAGHGSPEDTQAEPMNGVSAYERTIAAQNKTIEFLTRQVESLNEQMGAFVRSVGSQVPEDQRPENDAYANNAKREVPEDYVYLKDLGKEIGKR